MVSSVYSEFIAGIGSSAMVTLLFHPMDTIRINQINTKHSILPLSRKLFNDNFLGQNSLIKYSRGILRFYRAMPISCLAYSATYGVYFPISHHFKNENYFDCPHKYLLYMISTVPATCCAMTVTNALWTIKSIQISSVKNMSIKQSASKIYNTSGIVGFQKGLLFGYLNGMNGMITFTLYDILKDMTGAQSSIEYSLCSGVSKTCAYVITFPIFALKIKHQISQDTIVNVLLKQRYTFKSMYYGLSMTLLQMVPRTAVLMVLYEKIKSFLI